MRVYAGSASVELDGVVTQGTDTGPVVVYAEGATVEVRDVESQPEPEPATLMNNSRATGVLRATPGQRGELYLHGSNASTIASEGNIGDYWSDATTGWRVRQSYDDATITQFRARDGIVVGGVKKELAWWGMDDDDFVRQRTKTGAIQLFGEYAIDPLRLTLAGRSMGSYGACSLLPEMPDTFAAMWLSFAKWRRYTQKTAASNLGIPLTPPIDLIQKILDGFNTPFVAWVNAKNDWFGLWDEQQLAVQALQEMNCGFVYAWNELGHTDACLTEGWARIKNAYNPRQFVLGQGYPTFRNSSLDQPFSAPIGGINLGFKWRNFVETADGVSFELSNVLGEVTVDVGFRSALCANPAKQTVHIPADTWVAVSAIAAGGEESTPEPEPVPDEPEAPADPAIPVVHVEPLNVARVVCFERQSSIDRYDRYQYATVVGDSPTLTVVCGDYAAGGAKKVFSSPSYVIRANGAPVGTFVPPSATAVKGTVKLDLSAVPDGNVALTIDVQPPESNGTWWVIKGAGDPDLLPAAYQSYDWIKGMQGHKWVMLPKRFTPTPYPLKRVEHIPLVVGASYKNLHLTDIAVHRSGNNTRPHVLSTGQWTTATRQPYAWSQLFGKQPQVPLLDGPRGVGTICMPTDILIGRDGSQYVIDNGRRVVRVALDGHITTLFGWRHKSPASYWDGPQDLELVGDWSEIEAAGGSLGLLEAWRIRWRPRSITVDESAPMILNDRTGVMEHPHTMAPELLVTDTKHNRLLRGIAGSTTSHSQPWKVQLLVDGLNDPWGAVIDENDIVYCTERFANKIIKFPFAEPTSVTIMAQGSPLGSYVDASRKVRTSAALADLRAQPCVLPEGLDWRASDPDWLVFGSLAQKSVRRIHRHTHEIQEMFAPQTGGNSNFVQLSLGPDGTVYVVTWDLAPFGLPAAWRPDGAGGYKKWPLSINGDMPSGRGGEYSTWGYPSAVAASHDRIVFGGSHEGLGMLRMALPSDPTHSLSAYKISASAWSTAGYKLVHGQGGFGFAGLPLPADPAVAAYLAVHHEGDA